MNFNEACGSGSVQTSDLHLSGVPGATVTNVQVINGGTTAEFTININSIFSGTLTVNLPAGAITDTFGNPNAAFTGNLRIRGDRPEGLRVAGWIRVDPRLAREHLERAARQQHGSIHVCDQPARCE